MKKLTAKYLSTIFFMTTGALSATPALAACTIYTSNTSTYSIASNSTAIPNSFSFSCSPGSIVGSFTNLSYQATLAYKLQKQISGTWTTVATGSYINYSGTAGNYRYVVENTGGDGNYSFRYNHP